MSRAPLEDLRVSRRGLFDGGFLRGLAARALTALDPPPVRPGLVRRLEGAEPAPGSAFGRGRALPLHRPPGAVAEGEFLAGCTRCMDCATACPHQAIGPAPARARGAQGTPVIEAVEAPCWMCADAPCITACAPGVLRPDLPPVMGRAMIQAHQCLAYAGTTCSTCVERCPVPGAIALRDGRPRVDATACTGCGVCQHVCPAPENAVLLLPAAQRPAAPGHSGGSP